MLRTALLATSLVASFAQAQSLPGALVPLVLQHEKMVHSRDGDISLEVIELKQPQGLAKAAFADSMKRSLQTFDALNYVNMYNFEYSHPRSMRIVNLMNLISGEKNDGLRKDFRYCKSFKGTEGRIDEEKCRKQVVELVRAMPTLDENLDFAAITIEAERGGDFQEFTELYVASKEDTKVALRLVFNTAAN